MTSLAANFFNLFNAFAYLVIPLLMMIAVGMMVRKVPTWIFTTLFLGSLLRLSATLPYAVYSLQQAFGAGTPPDVAFFRFASVVGTSGGIVFCVGLFGLAAGMPFPPKRP